jgi:hypothetical protein
MISLALGDQTRGIDEIQTALDKNPFFNALLAEEAKEVLDSLGV